VDPDSFYLDYNATSPLSVSVKDWLTSGDVIFANPSSQHSLGKASRKSINQARARILSTFNKSEADCRLFFHSGATEGITSVAFSFLEVARASGRKLLICFSNIDHPCVSTLNQHFWGEDVEFFQLKLTPTLSYDHKANLSALETIKAANPELIILYHHLWVHNEIGLVSSLEELRAFKSVADLYLHVDAVQAPGKIEQWTELSVGDVWTFSAHKFGALKGIGFSLMNKAMPFKALFIGGGQQQNLRAGTENPQGIKSIELALIDLSNVDIASTSKNKQALEKFMDKELQGIGGVVHSQVSNSNTLYFYFNDVPSDIALALFDLNGLMISAGSACSSGAARPSLVLKHLGMESVANNGLRISLPFQFDQELLNKLQARLIRIFKRLKN
jgi:cysteine desulfurase